MQKVKTHRTFSYVRGLHDLDSVKAKTHWPTVKYKNNQDVLQMDFWTTARMILMLCISVMKRGKKLNKKARIKTSS